MNAVGTTGKAPVWRDGRAIALLMAASLTVMANATISPALPGIEAMFADHAQAGLLTRLLVPAPSLSVIFCAPLAGLAADRFGRRWLLLAGIALFVITGSAGLYLPDLNAIFASRLGLGVAVAMILTAQTALIGDYFEGPQRSALMGLEISARNFGGFIFIGLAGWLAATSPRLPFGVYGLAAIVLLVAWFKLAEPRTADGTATRGVVPTDGHPSWVLLVLALCLLQFTTNMIFFVMPTQLPFFLDDIGYDAATTTGLVLGALTLSGGTAALLHVRIKHAVGHAGTYALGYGLMAAGFVAMSAGTGLGTIIVGAIAVGAGYATVMPNFVALALRLAPATRRGLVGGMLATAIFIGQFVSPIASGQVIFAFGYDGAFRMIAILLGILAIGAVIARIATLTHRSQHEA